MTVFHEHDFDGRRGTCLVDGEHALAVGAELNGQSLFVVGEENIVFCNGAVINFAAENDHVIRVVSRKSRAVFGVADLIFAVAENVDECIGARAAVEFV